MAAFVPEITEIVRRAQRRTDWGPVLRLHPAYAGDGRVNVDERMIRLRLSSICAVVPVSRRQRQCRADHPPLRLTPRVEGAAEDAEAFSQTDDAIARRGEAGRVRGR